MADAVDKILLIPRFTCFAGAGPFYTLPINVRAYEKSLISVWTGPSMGTITTTASIILQESADLGIWSDVSTSIGGNENTEVTAERALRLDWARLKVALNQGPQVMTLWAVGNFVRRQTER